MAELGWQFSPKWALALQYFGSDRNSNQTLDEQIEWQDAVYDVGVNVQAETSFDVIRMFFARQVLDPGPHSLRLGVGVH